MESRWVAALAVAALSVGAGIWWGSGVAVPTTTPSPLPEAVCVEDSSEPAVSLSVHVAGWVMSPGVVEVPHGARVADAVAAAGGTRPGASLEAINLAQVLADGQQVVVPGPGARSVLLPDGGATSAGLIGLNTASAADLQALPGVGPVLAERIVAHREAVGGYHEVEDLLDVAGIGEAKLASIRDLVAVP